MPGPEVDLEQFRIELEGAFREVVLESDVVTSREYPLVTLTITGAPDIISVLFAQDAVIQAGEFTMEAAYGPTSFGDVVDILRQMARNGHYARKRLIGTESGIGEAPARRGVLTTAAPWGEALLD